jgi:hypothetical protein
LLIPKSVAHVSQIIGLGFLLIVFVKNNNEARRYWLTSFILFIIIFAFGQNVARSFLEPLILLYFGIALSLNFNSKYIKYFYYIINIQLFFVFISTSVGVYNLSPSLMSRSHRKLVMQENSSGYSVMKWADQVLPDNSCIISDYRSNALIPRKFVSQGYYFYKTGGNNYNNKFVFEECYNSTNVFLLTGNDLSLNSGNNHILKEYLIYPAEFFAKGFYSEFRNPFNRGNIYRGYLYKIKKNKLFL